MAKSEPMERPGPLKQTNRETAITTQNKLSLQTSDAEGHSDFRSYMVKMDNS